MVPVDTPTGFSFTSGFGGGITASSQANLGYILYFITSSLAKSP